MATGQQIIDPRRNEGSRKPLSLLETIRQYAYEKLSEAEEAAPMRDKHLAFCLNLVARAAPELYRSDQIFWMSKLDDELDNLCMALEWAVSTDAKSGMRLFGSLAL